MACCTSRQARRASPVRPAAAIAQTCSTQSAAGTPRTHSGPPDDLASLSLEFEWSSEDDDDVEYHTPPSSPRPAGVLEPPARTDAESVLLPELRASVLQHGRPARRELEHMATIYGGEEWVLLRYLRAAGGGRRDAVGRAASMYARTVEWRKNQTACVSPDDQRERESGLGLGPAGFSVPLHAELCAAAEAVVRHQIKPLAPFRLVPRPQAGFVLLCANIEFVDIVPLREQGLEPNFEFFVTVMEFVTIVQRFITAHAVRARGYRAADEPAETVRRCRGDVIVVDVSALALRHIDARFFYRVAVPILQAWQAHYPETMYRAYVLNAPRIFALVWKMIRPVLTDRVASRIVIATDDRSEELRELLCYSDTEPLPWLTPQAEEPLTTAQMLGPIL